MSSVKVLIFLLGAMMLIMEFQKASAASLFEDLDDDDILEDSDDFDLDEFDASKLTDVLQNDEKEKRGCANYGSRAFCERTRSWLNLAQTAIDHHDVYAT
ncbi:hypothetical protein ACROYT_G009202 [Oculina patagonica]